MWKRIIRTLHFPIKAVHDHGYTAKKGSGLSFCSPISGELQKDKPAPFSPLPVFVRPRFMFPVYVWLGAHDELQFAAGAATSLHLTKFAKSNGDNSLEKIQVAKLAPSRGIESGSGFS